MELAIPHCSGVRQRDDGTVMGAAQGVWSELGCHLCGGVRRNAGKGRWMMHWEVMVLERGGPE